MEAANMMWIRTSTRRYCTVLICAVILTTAAPAVTGSAQSFEGRCFSGQGDVEYLQLLEISRRMFTPDAEFQHVAMLYNPNWNSLVEGPHWGMWWVQNSYGPTYCALPFYVEPYITFLQNSQDFWFTQMGDGKTEYTFRDKYTWIPPDGCLVDAARPGRAVHRQGDARVDIHDWGMEFTAAGAMMQAELLLISRDRQAISNYLPMLERCANFIETRRDPNNNLFLIGTAGNLLAPSYAGWLQPDGTYEKAYLTGLSITYIALLDRLIELEKLADCQAKVQLYTQRRDLACKGLPQLTTDEGYFIKSLDPDGTKHGVYGADKHAYFEAVCNHDAICFRIVDEFQARRIYKKIASIPGLRPNDFIITNYPSLDDMYEKHGICVFGMWVNGGHWSTCEARMIMAYYRLGRYEDARRSMKKLLTFAEHFQMDNPYKDFGNTPWHDKDPINLCYDNFGPPAAMVRGLFEYLYRADGLTILPRVPPGITKLQQKFPIRFGTKKLYLSTIGTGPVTSVEVNGKSWKTFNAESIFLAYDKTPPIAQIRITFGGAKLQPAEPTTITETVKAAVSLPAADDEFWKDANIPPDLQTSAQKLYRFHSELIQADLRETYEAAHAKLAVDYINTIKKRHQMLKNGKLKPLPPESQSAADKSYIDTAQKLCTGLEKQLSSYAESTDKNKKKIYQIWLGLEK